jgi:cell shape-determining protein MreC
MVDFYFIFIALFYLVVILFIHVQLKKSIPPTISKKSILSSKLVQQNTSHTMTPKLTEKFEDNMDYLEEYDSFKSIADADNDNLTDEWSKMYENTQLNMKEEVIQNKVSTLDPEYQKTSLLDEGPNINNENMDINPFDEFDTTSYLSFAPTN